MTVYARSDVMGVAPSRDGHGGCGQVHSRPVEHGAPVKLWALTCPQCETFLRHDDQWSVTVSGIPETPDETAEREERERRGKQELEDVTSKALQQLGDTLPEAFKELAAQGGTNQQMMLAMLTALSDRGVISAPAATVKCANSHPMPPTAKFCPECGAHQLTLSPAPETVPASEPERARELQDVPDFEGMKIRELQNWARDRGVKTAVSKADQITLIREHLAAQG